MAFAIGKVGEFDETVETWDTYTERIEQYFLANDVPDTNKVHALLAIIGPKTYTLLKNLCAPDRPATFSYVALIEKLTAHLCPKPSEIAERFRFYKREQHAGESIASYIAELRRLALHCNFGNALTNTLRDIFVCGLRQDNIQKRLLAERTLTLDNAIKTAVAMETASKDACEVQQTRGKSDGPQVNKLYNKRHTKQNKFKKPQGSDRPKSQSGNCYRCGSTDHKADRCRHTKTVCNYCSKEGHLEKVCLKKKRELSSQSQHSRSGPIHKKNSVKYVEDEYEDFEPLMFHTINYSHRVDPIMLNVSVNGKPISMELDTGSSVSLIPENIYKEQFSDFQLQKTPVRLKTYSGENITPIGTLNASVHVHNQKGDVDLLVVPQKGPALFGRDWLKKFNLDWHEIKVLAVHKSPTPTCTPISTDNKLAEVLDKHKSVFSEGLGKLEKIKAVIYLEDSAQPKFHKARTVPYAIRSKVEAELERLESGGIISPVQHSNWASPIVPVLKKSGQVRICGDYKVTINPDMKVEKYPLPRIEDIFASLSGGQKFSKIDLTQAYLQMEVEDTSKELLTINTHKGLFRYNRLPFGVASAPAIWQRAMDQVLQNIPFTSCILDDMIISGRTDKEHLENLNTVLNRLELYNLKANLDKCEFFKDKVTYCGHIINAEGLQKSPEKVSAVLNAPKPEDVQQLRSFLGLVNYYRRFLPNLSAVVAPMNELLQNDKAWKWSTECDKAFTTVKELIISEKVLCHYNPELPVKVACDASPYGLGAVLSHILPDNSERPIAFASRSLTKAEKGYSQIDKEALGLYWGIQKFHTYLHGRRFTLVTDHKPLVSILHPQKSIPAMTAARLQRYALFLSGHTYDIEYRSTHCHGNADGLSRLPLSSTTDLNYIDEASVFYTSQLDKLPISSAQIRKETQRDPVLSEVLDNTFRGTSQLPNDDKFKPYRNRETELTCHQNCVMWGNRVVVPETLRTTILEELHDGHPGIVRMKHLARSYVWWPNIDSDIEHVCKSCVGCKHTSNMPKTAPVHPWEWPSTPWDRLHIDFAGPFMNSMFLVIVDSHSKWPEVYPMKSTTTTLTIEKLRILFSQYGIPRQLVSDNGPQFTSQEFETFMKQNGIRHITSAPYHPRTNGLAERFVQTFKMAMKHAKGDNRNRSLHEQLSVFLLKYRTTPHALTNETPAKLLYGRNLRTRLDLLKPDLTGKVLESQDRMKFAKHCGTTVRKFTPGQQVMVRDYRSPDRKWIPAQIQGQTGPLSYTVDPGSGTLWRRHTDQLRPTAVDLPTTTNVVPETLQVPESPTPTVSIPTTNVGRERASPPKGTPVAKPSTTEVAPTRRYPKRENVRPPVKLDL